MLSKPLEDKSSNIILKNDRLEITVLKPGASYIGGRFDWTGFITEVTLDGSHHFGASHLDSQGKHIVGRGLCNEFGMNNPVGIEGIEIGQLHPKIGVGLIPRIIDESHQGPLPSSVQPYDMHYHLKKDSLVFHTHPRDCRGFAVDYTKTISLDRNRIIVDYRLENVGTKTIVTEEYCHNFILVGDHKAGPDYELHFPYRLPETVITEDNVLTKDLQLKDRGLTWRREPGEVFYFNMDLKGDQRGWWQLTHTPTGIAVKESVSMTPHHFALWGESHVISPEIFVPIDLAPGNIQSWQRVFEFTTEQPTAN